jgi:sortase A
MTTIIERPGTPATGGASVDLDGFADRVAARIVGPRPPVDVGTPDGPGSRTDPQVGGASSPVGDPPVTVDPLAVLAGLAAEAQHTWPSPPPGPEAAVEVVARTDAGAPPPPTGWPSPAATTVPAGSPDPAAPVPLAIPEGFARVAVPAAAGPGAVEDAPHPATAAATPTRFRHGTRRTGLSEERRGQLITASTWVRNLGALLILFAAWQLWGTAIAQHHTQQALGRQFAAEVHAHPAAPGFTLAPAGARLADPPSGAVMAQLQIPAIGLDQYVVSGTDADDLAKGPGHYLGTAQPGQAGNVAIAGHRTTHGAPFNRLAELAPGDPIYLTTATGQRLTYVVAATPAPVSPSNTTVLDYFGDNRLTLTTCNPEYSAVQRLIVVAAYLPPGSPAGTRPAVGSGSGTPVKVTDTGEAGWKTPLLPLVLVELAVVVGVGLANKRLSRVYGREGRWLVLVPIWAALLFALFQTLTSFLPAAA